MNVLLSPGLVVCLDRESGTKDSEMLSFLNDPRIKRKKIVKILVSSSEDGAALTPFRKLKPWQRSILLLPSVMSWANSRNSFGNSLDDGTSRTYR